MTGACNVRRFYQEVVSAVVVVGRWCIMIGVTVCRGSMCESRLPKFAVPFLSWIVCQVITPLHVTRAEHVPGAEPELNPFAIYRASLRETNTNPTNFTTVSTFVSPDLLTSDHPSNVAKLRC